MRTRKRDIFCLVFLLYVLVYAASPLIFTLYCESSTTSHAGRCSSSKSFTISPMEKLEGMLAAKEETPSDSSAFWVLVKKRRALIPDDTVEEGIQPGETIASKELVSSSPAAAAVPIPIPAPVRSSAQDHHPLFRGHSPPSAASSLSC